MRGSDIYDTIASEIEQFHTSMGLSGKVTATVTNNGSNFMRTFQVYKKPGSEFEAEDEEGSKEVTFADLHNVLSTRDDDNSSNFILPPHHRCASHTFNLISNIDIEKWL